MSDTSVFYTIAHHATEESWEKYYDKDPGETGVHLINSAFFILEKHSDTLGILPYYSLSQHQLAIEDCKRLNLTYPEHEFAVVRICEKQRLQIQNPVKKYN